MSLEQEVQTFADALAKGTAILCEHFKLRTIPQPNIHPASINTYDKENDWLDVELPRGNFSSVHRMINTGFCVGYLLIHTQNPSAREQLNRLAQSLKKTLEIPEELMPALFMYQLTRVVGAYAGLHIVRTCLPAELETACGVTIHGAKEAGVFSIIEGARLFVEQRKDIVQEILGCPSIEEYKELCRTKNYRSALLNPAIGHLFAETYLLNTS